MFGKTISLQDKRSQLHQLFVATLKQVYSTEKELVHVLITLQEEAGSRPVKFALQDRRTEALNHQEKLENIFRLVGQEPDTLKCRAVKGLLKEANELVDETDAQSITRDVALVSTGRNIGHYKISLYTTLLQLASSLGISGAVNLLSDVLREEKDAELLLTEMSQSLINKLSVEKPV
ncbi:MAG: DUF892 family protein [Chitinophagaceae bacterium]